MLSLSKVSLNFIFCSFSECVRRAGKDRVPAGSGRQWISITPVYLWYTAESLAPLAGDEYVCENK